MGQNNSFPFAFFDCILNYSRFHFPSTGGSCGRRGWGESLGHINFTDEIPVLNIPFLCCTLIIFPVFGVVDYLVKAEILIKFPFTLDCQRKATILPLFAAQIINQFQLNIIAMESSAYHKKNHH